MNLGSFLVQGMVFRNQNADSSYIRVPKDGRLVRGWASCSVVSGTASVYTLKKGGTTVAGATFSMPVAVAGTKQEFTADGDLTAVFEAGDVLEIECDGGASQGLETMVLCEFAAGNG